MDISYKAHHFAEFSGGWDNVGAWMWDPPWDKVRTMTAFMGVSFFIYLISEKEKKTIVEVR